MINIQSTLRTATNLCKNVSLALLFASNGNSYTVRYVCMYTCSSQYTDSGQAKEIKRSARAVNAACQGNVSACHFGHSCQSCVSPSLLDSSCPSVRSVFISLVSTLGAFTWNLILATYINICSETRTTLIKIGKKMSDIKITNYLL